MVARRWRTGLIPLAAAVLALGVAGEASAEAARSSARSCKSPTAQPPNRSTGDNVLTGVAVISGCKAWAVGYYKARGGTRTLILYWNGKRWRVQRSPNPGRFPRHDELFAVAATSPTNAWAVGSYYNHLKAEQTLIERWNGTAWKVQKSPNPGGSTSDNTLVGVAATSSTNAWAVGNAILHWNGKAWKVQNSSASCTSTFYGVAATSPANAWAVGGGTTILHWNGTAWNVQNSSAGCETALYGVAAISPTNAWAVGTRGNHFNRTLIERWNGKAWKRQKSPNPGGVDAYSFLLGVTATSATNAWAVGDWLPNCCFGRTLIERWTGTAWKRQKSPNPGGAHSDNGLVAVAATGSTNAWAVGTYGPDGRERTLALHWNGTTWSPGGGGAGRAAGAMHRGKGGAP